MRYNSDTISVSQIPFCVVIGWPMRTHMDLNFELFETATLFITVLVVALMLQVRFFLLLLSTFYKKLTETYAPVCFKVEISKPLGT